MLAVSLGIQIKFNQMRLGQSGPDSLNTWVQLAQPNFYRETCTI